jgi:hypothetical protein
MAYSEDGLDWSRTKVWPTRHRDIWINLKGREPHGIVEPEEYEAVRDHLIRTLYSIRDPETGECPLSMVVRKEDAARMGIWGDNWGDVLFCFKAGYTDRRADRLLHQGKAEVNLASQPEVGPTQDVGSHHCFLGTAKLGLFSNAGTLVMSGPGLKKGYIRPQPTNHEDLTPTLASLLGIPVPKQCEGRVVRDFLEDA